jgi:hypothetical protein
VSGARGKRGDLPPSCRGIRLGAFARRLTSIPPAPQQKGDNAEAFRGELQTAARHCGERPDFADHCGDPGGAQPLLHRPQDFGIARRVDQHDTPGIEPAGGEPRAIEIRSRKAPQYHALTVTLSPRRDDMSGEGGRQRPILLVTARSQDFVQSASGNPTPRQSPVYLGDAEGQDPVCRRRRLLDPPNAPAQLQ